MPTPNQLEELKLNYDTHLEIVNTIECFRVPPRRKQPSGRQTLKNFIDQLWSSGLRWDVARCPRIRGGCFKSVWERFGARGMLSLFFISISNNLERFIIRSVWHSAAFEDLDGFQFEGIVAAIELIVLRNDIREHCLLNRWRHIC